MLDLLRISLLVEMLLQNNSETSTYTWSKTFNKIEAGEIRRLRGRAV